MVWPRRSPPPCCSLSAMPPASSTAPCSTSMAAGSCASAGTKTWLGTTTSVHPEPAARLTAFGKLLQHPAIGAVILVLLGRVTVERPIIRLGGSLAVQQQPLIVPESREQSLADR